MRKMWESTSQHVEFIKRVAPVTHWWKRSSHLRDGNSGWCWPCWPRAPRAFPWCSWAAARFSGLRSPSAYNKGPACTGVPRLLCSVWVYALGRTCSVVGARSRAESARSARARASAAPRRESDRRRRPATPDRAAAWAPRPSGARLPLSERGHSGGGLRAPGPSSRHAATPRMDPRSARAPSLQPALCLSLSPQAGDLRIWRRSEGRWRTLSRRATI